MEKIWGRVLWKKWASQSHFLSYQEPSISVVSVLLLYLSVVIITTRARYKTVLGIINESNIFIPPNELNTRQYDVCEI